MTLSELARRPKLLRRLAVAAAVVALYGLVGFFAAPPLLRSLLASTLTKALRRPSTVAGVAVNPFALSVRVRGLAIREPASADTFVSLDELYANVRLSSLLHLAPVLKEVRLAGLHVRIVRHEDRSYNFSDLLRREPQPGTGPSKPFRYALNNIQLVGGSVDFDDRPVRRVHTVRDLYVAVPFLSNMPDDTEAFVQPALRAVVNGTPVALGGRTKPFSGTRETSLDIDIRDLDVPPYLAYLPAPLPVEVRSARLSTRATLTFLQGAGTPSRLVLAGRVALADVALADAGGGELVAMPLLEVRIAGADLLAAHVSLARALLDRPRVRVSRDAAGRWNLAAFASTGGKREDEGGKAAPGGRLVLEVAETRVSDGTVLFADLATVPPFQATARAFELEVRGFSTAPGATATTSLSFATDAGETVRQNGELTAEPPAFRGAVEVAGVPVRRYAPYYRDAVAFAATDGVLGVSGRYAWSKTEGSALVLSDLAATLRSLRLERTGERRSFLVVPEAALNGSALDFGRRTIALGELSIVGARLLVARGTDGAWNLATLLPPRATGAAPQPAPPEAPATPWTLTAGRLALDGAGVEVEDALPRRPVRIAIAPLRFSAQGLSTVAGSRGRVDLRATVNASGSVALGGEVGLEPLAVRLTADVRAVPLVPLQGYLPDRVRLVVNDGTASASGEVTVNAGGEGPHLGLTGRASVDRLATVDADAAEDLLKWDALALAGVSFASQPLRLEIAEIGLSGLTARISVASDGTVNLRRVLGLPPAQATGETSSEGEGGAPPQAPAPPPGPGGTPTPAPSPPRSAPPEPEPSGAGAGGESQIRIDRITLRGGAIAFADRSVSPGFFTDVTDLRGSISGLSSLASTAGDVDLRATLNGQAALTVSGKVNPLAGNLFLDLKVAGRDFDLPAVSPYSGTYAGYAIERGKLSVDLDYKVAQRKLDAQNRLFLDQFDFGEKVESPKATHLPVRLAVSLLKDRNGQIKLDLPVSGSLDDPKFRLGRVILKMIGNLLVKVATSPFALLGALIGGGGPEIEGVAFAPGSPALDDAARGQLDRLAKALYDRPGLRIEVAGRADPVADVEGLRRAALDRAVKREKLGTVVRKGDTAPSLDAVVVEPGEYEKYLTRAYKHGKFDKPRNFLGIAKEQPVPEMERLLLASFAIGDENLRQLAAARAQAVQSYLVQTGKVNAGQVFVVQSPAAPGSSSKGPAARADFSLR